MLRPTRVEAGAAPEVLLTRAELVADGPSSNRFEVKAAFSNLHYETVQLLRIAVVGAGGPPAVAEVPAIVAARRAVELETRVVLRPGGRGRLDLYLFVPASPAKAWRLRVPLNWDPFARRYTAVLLGQRARPVRRLPEPEPPLPVRRRSTPARGVGPTPARRRARVVEEAPGAAPSRAATDLAGSESPDAPDRAGASAPRVEHPARAVPDGRVGRDGDSERHVPVGRAANGVPAATSSANGSTAEPPSTPADEPVDEPVEEPAAEPPRTPRLRFPDRF
jgi:hypothetical protein